jgi:type IV secretory pathway VirB4 component
VIGRRGRSAYRAERTGHAATTAHFQAAYPFLAEGGLGAAGCYLGRDAFGGAWVFDPWQAYERGILTGPNMLIVGQIGRGKSALLKTYIARQLLFGREAWVLDPKGEFTPLARALGGSVIALQPGGSIRLNAISSRMGREAQLSLLRSVAAAALRRELSPEEDAGLRVALVAVIAAAGTTEPTLPEVVDVLLHPVDGMTAELVMGLAEFAEATRQVALALQRLCHGDLRGMFDGETSAGLDLDARLVVLDLSAVQDSAALGILMTCAAAWLQGVVMERKRAAEAGERDGAKVIVAVDEAWRITADLGVAEWLQRSFKLSRAHGVQNIIALHRLSDLGAAGAAGSRESRIAEGLIADADTKVILAQPPDQLDALRSLLALSATEAELVPMLRRGEALWMVNRRSFLVQHRISAVEKALIDTDARMLRHRQGEGDRGGLYLPEGWLLDRREVAERVRRGEPAGVPA